MKKIPVARHLTDEEYKLLLQVYPKHNRSIRLNERANYNLAEIVRVAVGLEGTEKFLNIQYNNGEWFRYYSDGTWVGLNLEG